MSLYYDASTILTTPSSTGGSFKSRIYNSNSRGSNTKANPAQIYALITETAKWDILLKEVIERAEILKLESKVVPFTHSDTHVGRTLLTKMTRQLTPLLALFLVHDHLLSKKGIAATSSHPLRLVIEKHKTRLRGEFIKARVRRGCASVEELKTVVLREKKARLKAENGDKASAVYPRWVRINTVKTTLENQLQTTFAAYEKVTSLADLVRDDDDTDDQKRLYVDPHIPDLLAVPPGVEFIASAAYKNGEVILQDKASCFPAYLLAGDTEWKGDLVDGCAAPGNKTTHLAALLSKHGVKSSRVISMDASPGRSKTLQKMVAAAGAAGSIVTVLPGQDFLAIDPVADERFANVTGLLLDPSCSGSGIIGRDDVPQLLLPGIPENKSRKNQGKKRKRDDHPAPSPVVTTPSPTDENDTPAILDNDRLTKLSNIQARIVEHALSFPSATHVTYSTCSIHLTENESVVERVLGSDVARRRGWRVMRRDEQPTGLRGWRHRGIKSYGEGGEKESVDLGKGELEGCLRCWPGDEEGLGGFFVVGFVRDGQADGQEDEEDDEWAGFSD